MRRRGKQKRALFERERRSNRRDSVLPRCFHQQRPAARRVLGTFPLRCCTTIIYSCSLKAVHHMSRNSNHTRRHATPGEYHNISICVELSRGEEHLVDYGSTDDRREQPRMNTTEEVTCCMKTVRFGFMHLPGFHHQRQSARSERRQL